jgi:hypothetical protein
MTVSKSMILQSDNLKKFASIGQKIYFEKTVFQGIVDGIESSFIPYTYNQKSNYLMKDLKQIAPEVLIIYRPEVFDYDLLKALKKDYLTVGFFTEPLPFKGFEAEFDLIRRYEPFKGFNLDSCDFYVTYNPITCQSLENKVRILFSHPIPVSDDIYKSRKVVDSDIRGIFYGRVTHERNKFLMPLKHFFDWTVIDHGYFNESFFENFNVALNLHSDSYPNFENRVFYHMAQSILVLSEPLLPNYNLENEVHYFEFDNERQLKELVLELSYDTQKREKVTKAGFEFAQKFSFSNFIKELKNNLELQIKK